MSSPEATPKILKYWEKMGRLKLWSGVMAHQSLQSHQDRQNRNQEAEDAAVRRAAWGDNGTAKVGDEMGHTILGDLINPAPIVINSPPANPSGGGLAKTLAGLAIGALIPSVGIGGYLLSQAMKPSAPVVSPVPTTDDNLDIGLGRIGDLTK